MVGQKMLIPKKLESSPNPLYDLVFPGFSSGRMSGARGSTFVAQEGFRILTLGTLPA